MDQVDKVVLSTSIGIRSLVMISPRLPKIHTRTSTYLLYIFRLKAELVAAVLDTTTWCTPRPSVLPILYFLSRSLKHFLASLGLLCA